MIKSSLVRFPAPNSTIWITFDRRLGNFSALPNVSPDTWAATIINKLPSSIGSRSSLRYLEFKFRITLVPRPRLRCCNTSSSRRSRLCCYCCRRRRRWGFEKLHFNFDNSISVAKKLTLPIPPNGNAPSINQHLHQLRQRHITSGDNNANPFQFNFRKVPTLGRRVLMRLKKFCECQYASTFPRQNVV